MVKPDLLCGDRPVPRRLRKSRHVDRLNFIPGLQSTTRLSEASLRRPPVRANLRRVRGRLAVTVAFHPRRIRPIWRCSDAVVEGLHPAALRPELFLPLAVTDPNSWAVGFIHVVRQQSQSNGMRAIWCGVIRRTWGEVTFG